MRVTPRIKMPVKNFWLSLACFLFWKGVFMDKEFIKLMITPASKDDSRLIQEGDFIDSDLVNILCSAPISYMKNAFAPIRKQSSRDMVPYKLELYCPKCGSVFVRSFSKTKIMDALRIINLSRNGIEYDRKDDSYKLIWCDKCIEIEQHKRDQENKESYDLYIKRQTEKLDCYIDSYVNPNNSFKKELNGRDRELSIMDDSCLYFELAGEKIRDAVRSLSYSDFLKTPYWDGVRNYKLRRSGYKCELCSSNKSLNVHHKTYENHGLEHLSSIANKDLIVLCKDCHYKFHDKL